MAQIACNPVIYWIGSTTERFTISDVLINESSDLSSYNPNNGTGSGPVLNYQWVVDNFSIVNKYTFRGETSHTVDTVAGDAHLLIIVPTELEVTSFSETVLGTKALMTEGLHYDIFQISSGSETYDVYYLRDLTNFILPKRQFQFDVTVV
jgi:hypothetical protein